jgi:hypothetical protein
MTESEGINLGIKEIEDGYPVYHTSDKWSNIFGDDHRIMMVDDIYNMKGINTDTIFGRWQAKFYHFFEKNSGIAFTVNAFIDTFFEEELQADEKFVEDELKKMVKERIIKGVYVNGHYYYHY